MYRLLLIVCCALLFGACHDQRVQVQFAEVDLRQQDLQRPVQLEGQWRYYPNWLAQSFPESQPQPVRSHWQYVPTRLAQPYGFGTYELRLQTPEKPLLLYIGQVSSSSKLWLNGELISQQGEPHLLKSGYRPANGHHLKPIEGGELLLQVEVANYHLHSMGMRLPIWIGELDPLHDQLQLQWLIESALLSILFFLALYHAIFYLFLGRRMPELLPFSLLSLMVFMHTFLHTDIVIATLLKDFDWFWNTRLRYLAIALGSAAMSRYLMYQLESNDYLYRILRVNTLFGLVLTLILLVIPFTALVVSLSIVQLYALFTALWVLAALLLSKLQNQQMLWISAPLFALSIVSDVLFYRGIINFGPVSGWAFGLLLVLQSINIMQRLSQYWNQSHELMAEQEALYQQQIRKLQHDLESLVAKSNLASQTLQHDSLTGLANRTYFSAQLSGRLLQEPPFKPFYLLLIDVKEFRQFNIQQGIQQGDRFLQSIARELDNARLDNELLCRWGNGQFALLCQFDSDEELIAKRISLHNRLMQTEFDLQDFYFAYSCWQEGDTGASLMQRAEAALHQEKSRA